MQVLKSKKFIILIVLVLLSTITYVYAKYFNNYKESSLYTSEDFYFRSDVLSVDGVTYNYQRGITMISIKLYNKEIGNIKIYLKEAKKNKKKLFSFLKN